MGARLSSWWQKIKTHPFTSTLIVLFIAFVVLVIFGGYKLNWVWTGFNGDSKTRKTLWDWLQLFIIPFALAITAIFFNRSERKNEQRIALDNQQEAALQEYIKEMSELLLHEKLRESDPNAEVRKIAQVRTLTVLPRLDGKRKGSVLQFLHESGLIDKDMCIIDLHGADLNYVDLNYASLRAARLSRAKLHKAHLFGSNLHGVDFTLADLRHADLTLTTMDNADLTGAILISANLNAAHLKGAILNDADLSSANLKGAIMPDGHIHP